jgi:hypothetical protein
VLGEVEWQVEDLGILEERGEVGGQKVLVWSEIVGDGHGTGKPIEKVGRGKRR